MAVKYAYAAYPDAHVYESRDGKKTSQHLLWGDWVEVKAEHGDWCEVHVRRTDGWMKKSQLQDERLLEIVFVDIGQGDGALLVTPDDRHYLIDAGEGDNMYRFCNWRYAKFRKRWTFEAAVLTHPDADHYEGFRPLIANENVEFNAIYHNGLVERNGASKADALGPREREGDLSYCTSLAADEAALRSILADAESWRGKKYPTLLHAALTSGRVKPGKIRMLSAADKFVPGLEPKAAANGRKLSVAVLGPVTETLETGAQGLRWFGDPGKTKNGHSVLLRLDYGGVSVLFGGDLNMASEQYLLEHYTGLDPLRVTGVDEAEFLAKARTVFQCDIAKSCHHGSADVLDYFLSAVNPAATVISSGDDEPHAHPRAETLGAIGRRSRGGRPLIFSTELVRSTKEAIKRPGVLRAALRRQLEAAIAATDEAGRKQAEERFEDELAKIDRSVAVYGAINLRTDGERAVMAYRLEQARSAGGKLTKWDIYPLTPSGAGLRYESKHAKRTPSDEE